MIGAVTGPVKDIDLIINFYRAFIDYNYLMVPADNTTFNQTFKSIEIDTNFLQGSPEST